MPITSTAPLWNGQNYIVFETKIIMEDTKQTSEFGMRVVRADILDFPENAAWMIHGCNIRRTFGAGLAAQIARRYPAVSNADKNRIGPAFVADGKTLEPEVRRGGTILPVPLDCYDGKKGIINLYQQDLSILARKTGVRQLNYEWFYQALRETWMFLSRPGKMFTGTLAVPHGIGCGLAGGNWRIVGPMLEEVLVKSAKWQTILVKYDPDV